MNEIEKTIDYNGKKLTLKTGDLAPQADMAVLASLGGTTILATVVSSEKDEDIGFLPLTVRYEEKLYAGGIISGSRWVKREGRPSEEERVTGRLVDHAIRPLFPKDFKDEVQLVLTVLSIDKEANPELLALIASSAVLTASPLPFNGPISSIQLGYNGNELTANPNISELEESDLNLIISYLENNRVQAMEASANILDEKVLKEAIKLGFDKSKVLFDLFNDFAKEVGKEKREYTSYSASEDIYKEVKEKYEKDIEELVTNPKDKEGFSEAFSKIMKKAKEEFEEKYKDDEDFSIKEVVYALEKLQGKHLRKLVLEQDKRIDGRKLDEVRQISGSVNVIPNVHGSAIFKRGLTHVLSITTLGSPANTLHQETLYGEEESRYFHHYVALGFSVGEPRRITGPGNREVGHGMLAQNALIPVLPPQEDFPYVMRVVSEILSQNGSSSMASVCGSTLALMDAGVPIKDMAAGVSVGLVSDDEEKEYKIITDIQGVEDYAGGLMDFKLAGTEKGFTAIQMDIKPLGIPIDLFDEIIDQSKKARLEILGGMKKIMSKPNEKLKASAPKIEEVVIKKDQIGLIIGTGGKTIKELEETTGANLDVIEREDSGAVVIMSESQESIDEAVNTVKKMVEEPEEGKIYEGEVTKIFDFGALVEFLPGREGLVHVSELSDEYVENVRDHLNEGDVVKVMLKEISGDGKFVLTRKIKEEK